MEFAFPWVAEGVPVVREPDPCGPAGPIVTVWLGELLPEIDNEVEFKL